MGIRVKNVEEARQLQRVVLASPAGLREHVRFARPARKPGGALCAWRGRRRVIVDLNALVPAHRSSSLTLAVVDAMLLRSPYTARYAPSWAYIDDYLWYVLMWLRVARWKGNETSLVDEAAATFDLMWSFGADEACGGIDETNGEAWHCFDCNCRDFDPNEGDKLASECEGEGEPVAVCWAWV